MLRLNINLNGKIMMMIMMNLFNCPSPGMET